MGLLTRAQILAAHDCPTELVDVPEWANGEADASVRVRALNVGDRERMYQILQEIEESGGEFTERSALICSLGIVDDNGEPLFTPADIKALSRKAFAPMARLQGAIMRLSGMRADAAEEAEKN